MDKEEFDKMIVDAETGKQPDPKELKKAKAKKLRAELPEWVCVSDSLKYTIISHRFKDMFFSKYTFLITNNKGKETLYFYHSNKGYWTIEHKNFIRSLIKAEFDNASFNIWSATKENQQYQNILSSIKRKPLSQTFSNTPKLAFLFKNGVWDWSQNKLVDFSPDYYFLASANYDLDTNNSPTPETDKYFNLMFGEASQTIKEAIGYCFYPSYEPIQAYIILYGQGGEGKTWFAKHILTSMVGQENTSNIALKELAAEKDQNFKWSELEHKFINISSELSDFGGRTLSTAPLKMISGGDNINASQKAKGDINFSNYAKLFILTNELISFRDDTNGFSRRIYIIEPNTIKEFETKVNLKSLKKERGAFAYKCIQLAKEAMIKFNPETGKHEFYKTQKMIESADNWVLENDAIQQFINACITTDKGQTLKVMDIYGAYRNWCLANGRTAYNSSKFLKTFKKKGFSSGDPDRPREDGKQAYYPTIKDVQFTENADPHWLGNPYVKKSE